MERYDAAIWPGYNGERARWAVACYPSATWIFPRRYGEREARRLAERLNRDATPTGGI